MLIAFYSFNILNQASGLALAQPLPLFPSLSSSSIFSDTLLRKAFFGFQLWQINFSQFCLQNSHFHLLFPFSSIKSFLDLNFWKRSVEILKMCSSFSRSCRISSKQVPKPSKFTNSSQLFPSFKKCYKIFSIFGVNFLGINPHSTLPLIVIHCCLPSKASSFHQ